MPHVLWELQGQRRAKFVEEKDPHDPKQDDARASTASSRSRPGTLSETRVRRGGRPTWSPTCSGWASRRRASACASASWVLLFLGLFTLIAWRLNAAYWKDVK